MLRRLEHESGGDADPRERAQEPWPDPRRIRQLHTTLPEDPRRVDAGRAPRRPRRCRHGRHQAERDRHDERRCPDAERRLRGDELAVERRRGRHGGQEHVGKADAEREAEGDPGRAEEEALLHELTPHHARPDTDGPQDPELPGPRLEDGREPAEGDQESGHEAHQHHGLEEHLEGPHEAVEIELSLGRRLHVEPRRQHGADRLADGAHVLPVADHDIDAVDGARVREDPLGGEEVHHDEVAAVDPRHPLRIEEAAHGEALPSARRHEEDRVAHRKPSPPGEGTRQDHRIRLAQDDERVGELEPLRITRLVDAERLVVRDVHALDDERFAARVACERAGLDDRNGELDTGDPAYRVRDLLREKAPLSRPHEERRASRHRVHDLDEGAEYRRVGEVDRAHHRHPAGKRDDGEREAEIAAAQETSRHQEAVSLHGTSAR